MLNMIAISTTQPVLCIEARRRKPWRACSGALKLSMCAPPSPFLSAPSPLLAPDARDHPRPDFSNGALLNARVVLVGTQHSGNVGSVCRAAANFGKQSAGTSSWLCVSRQCAGRRASVLDPHYVHGQSLQGPASARRRCAGQQQPWVRSCSSSVQARGRSRECEQCKQGALSRCASRQPWHEQQVDPACDYRSQEGFNAAANTVSRDLMQQIYVKESLSQAIENCSMAVAFTRRTGKIRLPSFTLTELIAPEHANLKLALVFGREDCGLHTEELLQCTHVCTICSGSWQGSLNLSHAVAVVLSRLYESWAPTQLDVYEKVRLDSVAHKTLPGTANVSEVENLLHRWETVFISCNYWAKRRGMPEFKTPDRLFLFLRKLLQRARPSIREVAYLHGFLTVIEDLATVVSRTDKGENSDG